MIVIFTNKLLATFAWGYLLLMFVLNGLLPEWTGDENGIIENIQLVWLALGAWYCWRQLRENWGGLSFGPRYLWRAGCLYFFLLFMREISWGRTFFTNPDGSMYEYSQLGLYGRLVHPLVGVLLVLLLWLLWRGKVWRAVHLVQVSKSLFNPLLLFIFLSWLAERRNFAFFHGQVAEELAELGAYMLMYFLLRDAGEQLQRLSAVAKE